jgi:O-succinylbenzoic acid--CoA ligase
MERAQLKSQIERLGCGKPAGEFVFLCDPHWNDAERAEAERLMAAARDVSAPVSRGWLCIRTGGSAGGMKFARHDERTLMAAVWGFCVHFDLPRVNAVGVLPPWHVSGFMARFRCRATDGEYVDCAWKDLKAGRLPRLSADRPWVLSLVPTQLQRLLASAEAVAWLQRFSVIHLGGGPTWPELAGAAAERGLRISMSYGMTETAAMITAQRPEEFLDGDRSAGRPMPHGSVSITAEGRIAISAESLFRGYFPEERSEAAFVTQDLGRIDENGRLHVLGRADAVIITGGRKVQPLEVEAALRGSGEFNDVAVIGVPDPAWGEAVVACYADGIRPPDLAKAVVGLAPHQRPKRFVALREWPRNAQGKINRAALVEYVTAGSGR